MGTIDKPLAAIGKFSNATGKLIDKTLAIPMGWNY